MPCVTWTRNMAAITTKTIKPKNADEEPQPKAEKAKPGELASILNNILGSCGPTSEIHRLAKRGLEII